tara:strand:+ start:3042 stop:4208 length:1167 start_codon:yes stop_codon:yes gene_type:complete
MKRKILRVINRFNLGGPTYNAAYLTKYLENDYETLLVGGQHDDSEESSMHIIEELGLKPIIIPEMKREINFKNDRIAYKKLQKIIKDFKPDIVHTHASKAGAIGRNAAYNLGTKQIYHTFHGHVFHSYFGILKSNIYKNIEKNLAKKSNKIIAISDIQKHELSNVHKICSEDKIEVIPLGFDLTKFNDVNNEKRKKFRDEWNIKQNEIAIGIIGRLVPIKNHKFFIDIIEKIVLQTKKKIRFFIVGDGEEKLNLINYSISKNIEFSVDKKPALLQFTSWIKEIDIVNAGLDIICLCSKNEGTPVSLIEAQASEKPIVSTITGGIENVVIKNKTALLSKNGDIQGFVKNLLKLIESKKYRNDLTQLSKEKSSEFNYKTLISKTKKLYEQ